MFNRERGSGGKEASRRNCCLKKEFIRPGDGNGAGEGRARAKPLRWEEERGAGEVDNNRVEWRKSGVRSDQ